MAMRERVLGVVVAVLLVAGLATAIVRDDENSVQTVASSTTVPGETTTTGVPGSELDRAIAEIEAFVAQARGLPFKQRVKVTLLDDAAFRARLSDEDDEGESETDKVELDKTTKVLRALDLIDDDVDLEEASKSLRSDAVLGFYEFKKDELVVRGAELTPGVRRTLAHELTHALQDQHFELDRPELDKRDDEAESSFTGLVEGDARRIERQYTNAMSKADREEADEHTSSADIGRDVPRVLRESLAFPYIVGPPFAARVVQDGGQARLDEAFRSPPTTSEHLMHPATFLRNEQPKPVDEPPAEGEVFDRGVVGEFGLLLIMGDDIGDRELLRAAAGWGGDRYVAWEKGGRVCVRASFVMDTPKDTGELGVALDKWADEHDGVTVGGPAAGPLTFTSCR